MTRRKFIEILKWVWIVVVLLGAGWYFYRHYQEISQYLGTISITRLVLCFFLLLAGKFALSDISRLSLKKINYPMPYTEALTITTVTQLGKYLPGGIWHFAGKFGVYKLKGMSTKESTQALVLENLWLFSSSAVVGIFLLALSGREVICSISSFFCNNQTIIMVLILLPLVLIIGLLIFDHLFLRQTKINLYKFSYVLFIMIVLWFAFGISYWLVFPPTGGFLVQIIGAFSVSWLAGYAAIFAPGGIGIRELVLTGILSSFFTGSEVAIYATVHRLLWVLAEIVLGGGCALVFGLPGGVEANESH